MAKLTLQDANRIAANSRPWSLRLEFVGANPANASGTSAKFWYATGRSKNEAIETGSGAIGSAPVTRLVDWAGFQAKVAEKLGKGYDYVDAPFQRMSQANMAKLGGHTPSPTPQKAQPPVTAPTAPPVSAPVAAPAAPPVSAPVAVQPPAPTPAPAPQANAPTASLLALPAPFCNVRFLKFKRQGAKVLAFDALDENQNSLLEMTQASGLDFARDHDVARPTRATSSTPTLACSSAPPSAPKSGSS